MLPVSDISQAGPHAGHSQAQSTLIASVISQQKVIAAQRSNDNSDAGGESFNRPTRAPKQEARASEQPKDVPPEPPTAEARSIIEAQEASAAENKVDAAFSGQYSFTELLSVIRDPEDLVLPNEPEDLRG